MEGYSGLGPPGVLEPESEAQLYTQMRTRTLVTRSTALNGAMTWMSLVVR